MLVVAQAAFEADCPTGNQTSGSFALQSEDDQKLSSERRVQLYLAVYVALLGGAVSGQVVYKNHALED